LNTAPWQGVDETGNTSKAHLGTGLGNVCSGTLKVWGTQTSLNNYKQHLTKTHVPNTQSSTVTFVLICDK
jgi:hypothetical protein